MPQRRKNDDAVDLPMPIEPVRPITHGFVEAATIGMKEKRRERMRRRPRYLRSALKHNRSRSDWATANFVPMRAGLAPTLRGRLLGLRSSRMLVHQYPLEHYGSIAGLHHASYCRMRGQRHA